MPDIIDDKSEHCIPFIERCLADHRKKHNESRKIPFFLGLNGVQGAGKTTLVSTLCENLSSSNPPIPTAIISIDDFYLKHEDQVALSRNHSSNPILQHRGQPSTHDIPLLVSTFASLREGKPTKIPVYDKSAFSGQGDRAPEHTWSTVNAPCQQKVEVVVLEGWCVGFRPVWKDELEEKWRQAVAAEERGNYDGQLGRLKLEDVKTVNDALTKYNEITDMFDAFVHIDAEDPRYVYDWRLQQEEALRAARGSGMTDNQVIHFVNGYYPAYELYTDVLRAGVVKNAKDRQLRLVVGKDRRVKDVHNI